MNAGASLPLFENLFQTYSYSELLQPQGLNRIKQDLEDAQKARKSIQDGKHWWQKDAYQGWEVNKKASEVKIREKFTEAMKDKNFLKLSPDEQIQKLLEIDLGDDLDFAKNGQKIIKNLFEEVGSGNSILLRDEILKHATDLTVDPTNSNAKKELTKVLNLLTERLGDTDSKYYSSELLQKLGAELDSTGKLVFNNVNPEQALHLVDSSSSLKGFQNFIIKAGNHQFAEQITNFGKAFARDAILEHSASTRGIGPWISQLGLDKVGNVFSHIPYLKDIGEFLGASTYEKTMNVAYQRATLNAAEKLAKAPTLTKAASTFGENIIDNLPLAFKTFKASVRIPIIGTLASLAMNNEFKGNVAKAFRGDLGAGFNALWEVGKNFAADFGTMAIIGGGLATASVSLPVLAATAVGGTVLNMGIQATLDGAKNTAYNFATGFTSQNQIPAPAFSPGTYAPQPAQEPFDPNKLPNGIGNELKDIMKNIGDAGL